MSDSDETPDNSDKTILSVDDDPVNQMVIASLFEAEGYNVAQAMDGFEALDYMKSNKCPDIVLLDVMMPGLSGYEVLDKLREEYTPDLPVIMISAKASLADRIEGLTHFCNDYQTKPFEKNELLQRVASWIELRRLIESSNESAKIRAALKRSTPASLVPALFKDSSIVTKLENVITMVIYIEKVRNLLETQLKEQMKFLQFMKILAKFNDLIEGILNNKKVSHVIETSGTQITVHFTDFDDIIAGAKFVTSIANEILSVGERFNVTDKLTLDKILRMGLSCGRGIGGVVNGRFAIATGCFIESLVLAERGVGGYCHLSYMVKSAANIPADKVVERARFNGRPTFILKKSASDPLSDVLIPEDLGIIAGSTLASSDDDAADSGDGTRPRNIGIQVAEEQDPTKKVQSTEADTPPIPPVEPPKKPPEPIVRRRGDMIREELRARIQRLMVESEAETISGNSLLRFQTLNALYAPRPGHVYY